MAFVVPGIIAFQFVWFAFFVYTIETGFRKIFTKFLTTSKSFDERFFNIFRSFLKLPVMLTLNIFVN